MKISCFDYTLPKNLIANSPMVPRDHSKLVVVDRKTNKITYTKFHKIGDYLTSNDVLVLNQTKVFPARFCGKKETGGKIEVLLLEETKKGIWEALTTPGIKEGQTIEFKNITFKAISQQGQTVTLETKTNKVSVLSTLKKYGITPLPPYIKSSQKESDVRREYQTVYAKSLGSVAAPTAGFHFTKSLLKKLKNKGVQIEYVTLHVGIGTFSPVKTKRIEDHPMHFEHFEIEEQVAERLNKAKREGKRIIAVGTTTTRLLESSPKTLKAGNGKTNIFIYPPFKFKFVDSLITNFHLPKSTLLCLVSAFTTYPNTTTPFKNFEKSLIGKAYKESIKRKYRFYSFGDACFIV